MNSGARRRHEPNVEDGEVPKEGPQPPVCKWEGGVRPKRRLPLPLNEGAFELPPDAFVKLKVLVPGESFLRNVEEHNASIAHKILGN